MQKNKIRPKPPLKDSEAWVQLIKLARHKPKRWTAKRKEFMLERGDFFCKKTELAKKWGWPVLRVKRFFRMLEKEGLVAQIPYPGIGTLCKFVDLDDAIEELFKSK